MVLSESTRLFEETKSWVVFCADQNRLDATIKTSIALVLKLVFVSSRPQLVPCVAPASHE